MSRAIPPLSLVVAAALLLTACASAPDLTNHLSDADTNDRNAGEVLSFEDGGSLASSTVVGVHAELGDDWLFTDGSASLGYGEWTSQRLGCVLMLVVATPIADLPHDRADAAGSARLSQRYGSPEGEEGTYLYPALGGGLVEMASLSYSGEDGSRTTLAREFAQLRSAVILDLGCDGSRRIVTVLREIDVSITVSRVH